MAIPDAVSCGSCRIEIASRIRLRTIDEGDPVHQVRIDPQGRFWLLRESSRPEVLDAKGQLQAKVGRMGRGPGEFGMVTDVLFLPGDSALILDADERRWSVFTSDLRYVRAAPRRQWMHSPVVVRWPDRIVGNVRDEAGTAARSLAVIDLAQATPSESPLFGPPGTDQVSDYGFFRQHLARADASRILSVDGSAWKLYEWSVPDGRLLRRWQRVPAWLPQPTRTSLGSPTIAPSARMVGVSVLDREVVLVVAHLPSSTWREGWPVVAPGTREVRARDMAIERMFTTLVEAVDLRTGRVLARLPLADYAVSVLPGERLAMLRTDANGEGALEVITLGLTR